MSTPSESTSQLIVVPISSGDLRPRNGHWGSDCGTLVQRIFQCAAREVVCFQGPVHPSKCCGLLPGVCARVRFELIRDIHVPGTDELVREIRAVVRAGATNLFLRYGENISVLTEDPSGLRRLYIAAGPMGRAQTTIWGFVRVCRFAAAAAGFFDSPRPGDDWFSLEPTVAELEQIELETAAAAGLAEIS